MSFTLAVDFTVFRLDETPVLTLERIISDHFIKDKKMFHLHHQRSPADATSDPMLHPINRFDHPVVDSSDPTTYTFPNMFSFKILNKSNLIPLIAITFPLML